MKGLIIAEVEFKSVEQAEDFKLPSWFGMPVEHKEFSNRALSTKSRHEIMELVGKEQLAINKRIWNYLNKKVLTKKSRKV